MLSWRNAWKDPVWSAVIAAGILASASAAVTYVLNLWPLLGKLVLGAYDFTLGVSALANWLIGLLVLFSMPTIIVLFALFWRYVKPKQPKTPDWRHYTYDHFFGLRWRWRYLSDGSISQLHTFCPRCDYQIFPHNVSAFSVIDHIAFHCDSCQSNLGDFQESYKSLENKAVRFAQQKLRNGRYSTALS